MVWNIHFIFGHLDPQDIERSRLLWLLEYSCFDSLVEEAVYFKKTALLKPGSADRFWLSQFRTLRASLGWVPRRGHLIEVRVGASKSCGFCYGVLLREILLFRVHARVPIFGISHISPEDAF